MSNSNATEPGSAKTGANKKTVSLILGSGGARGLAHIGVIQYLQENDYDIQFISGSSMGALVGGVFAAGKLDEFSEWFKSLSKTDILGLADIAWERSGLIKGDKLFNHLKEMIGNPDIKELNIPFTAVATDIDNEREVWLQQGSMLDAVRASIALPMIFTPVHRHGRTLIDGGVLNPIPIAPTFGQTNDLTIAVNLGGKPQQVEKQQSAEDEEEKASWLNNVSDFFEGVKQRLLPKGSDSNTPFNWDMYDVSNKAFDSMQSSLARQKIAAYPPDILIEISRDACGMLEFNQASKMIELGYQAAKDVIEKHQQPNTNHRSNV